MAEEDATPNVSLGTSTSFIPSGVNGLLFFLP
jgi:hypothetical protein